MLNVLLWSIGTGVFTAPNCPHGQPHLPRTLGDRTWKQLAMATLGVWNHTGPNVPWRNGKHVSLGRRKQRPPDLAHGLETAVLNITLNLFQLQNHFSTSLPLPRSSLCLKSPAVVVCMKNTAKQSSSYTKVVVDTLDARMQTQKIVFPCVNPRFGGWGWIYYVHIAHQIKLLSGLRSVYKVYIYTL